MNFFKSFFGKNNKNIVSVQDENNVQSLKINAKSKILIGLPAIPPSKKLVDSIVLTIKNHSIIKQAYIFAKKNNDSPVDAVLTLGFYIKENTQQDLLKTLMTDVFSIIKQNLKHDEVMDIIILNNSGLIDTIKKYKQSLIYEQE